MFCLVLLFNFTLIFPTSEELVRLEKELVEIRRVTQSSPITPGLTSLEEALKEGSVGSSTHDSALPSSQATTPTLPMRSPRTPGPYVSHLISMFESASQSSSPVCSESSERPGSVEQPSSLSHMLQKARWPRRRSCDESTRSGSTNSEDGRSLENARFGKDRQSDHRKDSSGSEVDGASQGSDHVDKHTDSVFLEYGLDLEEEVEVEVVDGTQHELHSHPSTIPQRQSKKQQQETGAEGDIHIHPTTTQNQEEQLENDGMNWSATVVEDDALEPVRDLYMETSHLMKLMNEVAEQRAVIIELREQVIMFALTSSWCY